MSDKYFTLPTIITLPEFGGDAISYLEAVYAIFKKDFVDSRPVFKGKRLGLKKYPLIEGKEYTFYHFTHEGDIEVNRLPNLRRMERISWPRPLINGSEHSYLKVWKNNRGHDTRILIFHDKESYLVVLADRGDYILPWTGFLVDIPSRKRRLLKEYESFKKANAAQKF